MIGNWLRGMAGLLTALALTAAFLPVAAGEALRVMALGDSITEGTQANPSYRPFLWKMVKRSGGEVDFVGSMRAPAPARGLAEGFDPDHEGHWGWHVEEVLSRIEGWAARARPDIVLIHLGTNDIGTGGDLRETVEETRRVIEALRKVNPGVTVLLARIIPLAHPGVARRIGDFNDGLAALALSLHRVSSPVVIVDHFEGFDPRRDTYDGVHPNAEGAEKMARRWHDALLTLLPRRDDRGR
jgi:lysophospholipase L1-like esterase